jgi:hypothetical protein
MGCGSSSTGNAVAQQEAQQKAITEQSVGAINNAFSGFTPAFYQQAATNYNNWALPQLQTQYQTANNQLGYKMADQGIMNGTAKNTAQNALSASMSQNQSNIANAAVDQENSLKSTVGTEKANLMSQAQTASDPAAMASSAAAMASTTTAPSSFASLGSMFSSFGNQYLASQSANANNAYTAAYLAALGNQSTNSSSSLASNIY